MTVSGPLAGIKVLDLSRTLAGPLCTMILADFGAEVLKVERPGKGDETRGFGPPYWGTESCYYLSLNRNKRAITLDLQKAEGQRIAKRLADEADIIVENFRTGYMEKFGLGYDNVAESNPRVIYCSVSGFGRTGPLKDEPAYDLMMQGFGGLMSVTGYPSGPPVRTGFSVADLGAGLYATIGILAALHHRDQTGIGQRVESSLMETMVSLQTYLAIGYLATGDAPGRHGSAHPTNSPYQAYRCVDDYIIIACPNDGQWHRLCSALDLPHLENDPLFATNADRVINRDALNVLLEERLADKTAAHVLSELQAAGVVSGPVNTIADILQHPQIKARDMLVPIEHPTIGPITLLGVPIKLSETPGAIRTPPPTLSQHTRETLLTMGYSDDQIETLESDGVI